MALLAPQAPSVTGTTPAFVAASAGGDTVMPGDNVYLHAKNGSGGSITVTVAAVRQCDAGVLHDLVVSIPAGEEREFGPVNSRYARTSDGLAAITYSGVTSLTIRAVKR